MVIKDLDDYLDVMQEKYPSVKREELKKVIQHGFLTLHAMTRKGIDIVSGNWRYSAYFGKKFQNKELGAKYYVLKMRTKLRATYKFAEEIFDGRYYFGLTDAQWDAYKTFVLDHKGRRKKFTFHDLRLYKIREECFLETSKKHFFTLYYPIDHGWQFFKNEITTRNFEYLGYRDTKNKIVYI